MQSVRGVLNADLCQERALRAPRANRVFRTDEKRIRSENTVTDKSKGSVGVLSKIPDCVRTDLGPRAIGDPRGRAAVRASPITSA
jgi:hypothetical protein